MLQLANADQNWQLKDIDTKESVASNIVDWEVTEDT